MRLRLGEAWTRIGNSRALVLPMVVGWLGIAGACGWCVASIANDHRARQCASLWTLARSPADSLAIIRIDPSCSLALR